VADLIADVLDAEGAAPAIARVSAQVTALCRRFPVYESSQARLQSGTGAAAR
jgi:glycine/serine hydroxymethyltransferase